MRITLGGVLLLGGAVAAGYYAGHTAPLTMVKSKAMDLTKHVGTLVGLYQAGDAPAAAETVYSPPPPFPNGSVGELGVAGSTDTVALGDAAIEASTETVVAAVVATPTPTPAVKKKPVAKRPSTAAKKPVARRTTTAQKRPAPKKPAPKRPAPAAAKPANPVDRLMGTYVSLELITGRAVQGILESKSATHYKLNVPGLGPLDYPIENVRTVSPAQ